VVNRILTRLAVSFAVVLVMLVATVVAFGFFVFAIYLALENVVMPPVAAALTGVCVLLLAALFALAARLAFPSRRPRTRAEAAQEATESTAKVGSEVGRRLRGFADAHANGTLIAALLAGLAVGASPKLRTFLREILKL
jgi:hypothetical protein